MHGDHAYDVFLSYSRADSAAAETLRARLREAGLSAFLDRHSLPAGQPWQPWLEHHLGACRALLALVGPNGLGEWQQREIQVGLSRQVSAAKAAQVFPVIPVLLPGLSNEAVPIGRFLKLNTYVDLRAGLDDPEALQRLVAGAQGKAINDAAAQRLLAGLSPYRGLLPFREQDAGLFFGRERFVDELANKVRKRTATNVVAVVGRSGSGKSSIVYAGLMPALRRERGVGGQSVWKVVDLRPYAEPLNELAAAFDPPAAERGSIPWQAALNERAQIFRDGKLTLAQLVRARLKDEPGSTRLLLYVDQWEELYTQAGPRDIKTDTDRARAADVKLFVDLVLDAAASSPCTLVFSVRSDFYPDLQTDDGLRVAVQESQVSLGTMNEAELRDGIEGPPKALGARVDPELTKKLIRDIGLDSASGRSDAYDIGKLPLLEYALEQAWAKRTGPQIGLPQYSGLEQALEERANALYGRLSAQEQAAAKRLFVSLVTPGEGREDTRARIAMPDDVAMRAVIETFAGGEARLVVTDEAGGRRSVEVSHESLIRHWDRLRAWVDENRDGLRTRAFLKANREEWLKHGRSPGLLDLPSLYVEAARSLHQQPGDVVIDDVKDYIDALLDHQRRRLEAEAAKRREELEAAQRTRRTRAKLGGLAFFVVAGLIAWRYEAWLKDGVQWVTVVLPYMQKQVQPYVLAPEAERTLKPGDRFRECSKDAFCPEMIVVPAGQFMMGSPDTEDGRFSNEGPQHKVVIARPFAVSKFDVTFDDWDACVSAGRCPEIDDLTYGRETKPLINASWAQAQTYVAWFSRMTGKPYRLLTEAEWEYAARAGSTTAYSWGDEIGEGNANCIGCGSKWDKVETSPVGSFAPNAFGLYDMAGDVWQWVQDCNHQDYERAPADGSEWTAGDCNEHVVRGGSWLAKSQFLRSAFRGEFPPDQHNSDIGFRVARTLAP